MSTKQGWLLLLGGLIVLGFLYLAYVSWSRFSLAKAMHDTDPVVRINAVREAAKIGDAELLIKAVHDEDPDVR
jgi:hypothetical protein